MVMSVDGVTSKDDHTSPLNWTSKEDKAHYVAQTKKIGVLLKGANTYKSAGARSFPDRKLYVLTHDPKQFEPQENVEFVSGIPPMVLARLEADGVEHVALVGGASVNGAYLKAGLVDDIYLTLEPKLFGRGMNLSGELNLEVDLQLKSIERLNNQGSIILHYQVIK